LRNIPQISTLIGRILPAPLFAYYHDSRKLGHYRTETDPVQIFFHGRNPTACGSEKATIVR